jgi:uncharacterized protein (DUF924 family)
MIHPMSLAVGDPHRADAPAIAGITPQEAVAVVDFWRNAGSSLWFAKDAAFDQDFKARFIDLHDSAAAGALSHWLGSGEGALALILLLDQFPRNAFRETPRMYATDALARAAATAAIAAGHDRRVSVDLQLFFYLPFGHSEDLADQDRSVALCARLPAPMPERAEHHRDIIRRFARFPHRNTILVRETTSEERLYLDGGGYAG